MSMYRIFLVISSLYYHLSVSTLSLNNDDIISTFSESSTVTNEFETDDNSYWRSKSYFHPVSNSSYGSIEMRNSFYMKFNMIWHGLSSIDPNRPFEGIFRIGTQSTNVHGCDGHATRYPALYVDRKDKSLQFSISDSIDCWGVSLINVSYYKLEKNQLYDISIQYNQQSMIIRVNDDILYNDRRPGVTPNNILNTTQSIMISDAIDPAANVTLYDMIIISYDDDLSLYPTISPTPSPSVSLPTNVATLSPTLRAITSSTKDTTHTTETIDDIILSTVDDINGDNIFIVEIVVTISVLQNNDNNNQTFNNTMIKSIIEDQIFPDTNLTNLDINIDTKEEDIIVNMTISIGNKQELTRLNGYLKTNLTIDLMNNIQESLPRNTQILEIHYQIHIKEIYIEESSDDSLEDLDENDQDLSSLIPLNEETVLYIVIAAISLCFCSFILCICILCRYCKLRHKIKVIENRDRGKTGSILSIQHVKPQKIVKRSDVDGCDGYNASNQNKLGRTSTIDECLECENPIALIHEIEELKRLSESRNAHELPSVSGNHRTSPGSGSGSGSGSKSNPSNPSGSGDMDELSLGTHVIHTSEGLGGEKLQSMNDLDEIDALDDDLDDERCHILALPSLHAVESAKSVNSNISDTTFIIRNLSNLNMLNQSSNHSNLDIMIEDQIKVTNRYSSNNENLDIKDDNDWNDEDEDDDDDLAELHSMDSSSNEAMYDEGLRRGSSINPTKKGSSTMSRVKKIHGLPPPHQSMQ